MLLTDNSVRANRASSTYVNLQVLKTGRFS